MRPETSQRYLASHVAMLDQAQKVWPGAGQRAADVVLREPVELGKHSLRKPKALRYGTTATRKGVHLHKEQDGEDAVRRDR